MKRVILALALVFALVATSVDAYAVEASIGASFQPIGLSILRGSDAKSFIDDMKTSGLESTFEFLIESRIDVMVEFSPYLALETGIGQRLSMFVYDGAIPTPIPGISVGMQNVIQRLEFIVPVMLRGQYEFERQLIYASVGVKLGIPITNSYVFSQVPSFDIKENLVDSKFSMDVSFALGLEGRLGDANYLGVRLSYDLNVIEPFDDKEMSDFNHDSFGAALTYRYAFNSKWKKKNASAIKS